MENFHNIPTENLISRSDSEVVVEIFIPSECDYFDGHFPNLPLLPAVAQVDIVAHFAGKYFGISIFVQKLKRIKFINRIVPDSTVLFKIKFDSEKGVVSFEILSSDGKNPYSSGSYIV